MIANIFIELGWIAATVLLILNDHPVWAGVCVCAGIFSGYTFKRKA